MKILRETKYQNSIGQKFFVPTMQYLAFYAHDHFGEAGDPFEESLPSSLDVVVGVYARWGTEAADGVLPLLSTLLLRERLLVLSRHGFVPPSDVTAFVADVMTYLRFYYPDPQTVREYERYLSVLFWGNLVEARLGHISSPSGQSGAWHGKVEATERDAILSAIPSLS